MLTYLMLTLVALPQEAVPSRTDEKKVRTELRGIYRTHYDAGDGVALLAQAETSADNPTARYVLLEDARDLALKRGDVETAFTAQSSLATEYKISDKRWLSTLLKNARKSARSPKEIQALHRGCLFLAQNRASEEDFTSAKAFVKEAATLARVTRSAAVVQRTGAVATEISELADEAEDAAKAKTTLEADPKDVKSARIYGLYLAFAKRDWDRGLAFMAEDPVFKAAAEAEILKDAPKAADAWETAAKKSKLPAFQRARILSRAAYWLKAQAADASGVTRAKIHTRLDEMEGRARIPVELLPLIDRTADSVLGQWTERDGGISTILGSNQRIKIPYIPPAEYDLKVLVKKAGSARGFFVGLPAGGTHVLVEIDDLINGNLTTMSGVAAPHQGTVFADTEMKTLEFLVRRGSITVLVDGAVLIEHRASKFQPSTSSFREVPDHAGLFMGWCLAPYIVKSLELRPVTGRGKRMR